MADDFIKIQEDAVKIQEADLQDTIKSIEAENTKSSFVLIFASVLIVSLKDSDKFPLWVNIFFLVFAISSIIIAFYNISSKKIHTHSNVDEIFVKNTPTQWEEHLRNKHLFLRDAYQEVKDVLYKKAFLTKVAFIFVALATILISIANIII